MEEFMEDDLSVRQFLQEFNKDLSVSPTGEDGVNLRGTHISAYRLLPVDIIPEVTDWVLHYLEQRKCPRLLADFLSHSVAESLNASTLSKSHSNGIPDIDENETLIDSVNLYTETMEHLHELCNHLRNAGDLGDLRNRAALSRVSYPVSVCGIKNARRKMEDRHVVIHDLSVFCDLQDDTHTSYYAIFDGHGGVEAANYSAAHLHWNIAQHPLYLTDLTTAIRDAFKRTDEDFLCKYSRDGIKSGCTAICCIIRNEILHMAWVGDSQAILVRQGQPLHFMEIHKPERQDERQRIEDMGGTVTFQDGWRVNNAIGVSRAIGDAEFKKWVSSDADVCTHPFAGTEDFLVVACDGLWDAMSPADVNAVIYHQLLQRTDDIEDVAAQLVHHAKDQGSKDNISAIVIFLRDPASLAMQATTVPHFNAAMTTEQEKKQNGLGRHIEENGLQDCSSSSFDKSPDSFEQQLSNPFGHTHFIEDSFAAVGGSVPEKTAYSELPTPPIEDVLASEEFLSHSVREMGDGNPFVSPSVAQSENLEDQSRTTEIASDIVNTAIETALEICSDAGTPNAASGSVMTKETKQIPVDFTEDDIKNLQSSYNFVFDQQEVSMGAMMEIQDLDVTDGLPKKEALETNPFATSNPSLNQTTDNLAPDLINQTGTSDSVFEDKSPTLGGIDQFRDPFATSSNQQTNYFGDPFDRSGNSPFFSDNQTDFLNFQQKESFQVPSSEQDISRQENPFFSGPDSLLLYSNIGNMQMNVETNSDLFSLTGEAPSAVRPLQGVPEMIGISESVPGSRTPEMVSIGPPSPSNTFEKLSSTFGMYTEDKNNSPVLESVLETLPMLDEKITILQASEGMPMAEPKVDEDLAFEEEVLRPTEMLLANLMENAIPGQQTKDFSETVSHELAQPITKLEQSLSVEVTGIPKPRNEDTLTPAVVVESIPENVPEADGVTEDSDSEKDGGWKYVSGEKQPKKASPKTPAKGEAASSNEPQPVQKDTRVTDTVKRAKPAPTQTTRKPLANKPSGETKTSTIQKKPSTMQTAKTTTQSRPLPSKAAVPASGTMKPKTATKTTSSDRLTTAPSDASKTRSSTSRTTATSSATSRLATKISATPSTMQKPTPASTVARKPKPVAVANKPTPLPSSTATLHSATARAAPIPKTSTLPARPQARKPLVNGDSAATSSDKKPSLSNTMKPQRLLVPKPSTQAKEAKETVNKEISKMPSPKQKPGSTPSSTLTASRRLPQNGVKNTLSKASTTTARAAPIKKSNATSKETPKNNKSSLSPAPRQQIAEKKLEKEKGLLEENTKETDPVNSGLASPISPQLSNLEIPKGEVEKAEPGEIIQQ